jgi:apolipoprotein N-acyltransferase
VREIIRGFGIAFFLSAFIYLEDIGVPLPLLNAILGLGGLFFLLLEKSRKALFSVGFFVGIFWFFWIGFSVQYYGFPYLVPLVVLFFATLFGGIFLGIGYFQNLIWRVGFLIAINEIHLFGFDWFRPQIIFINSPFGTELWQFGIILIVLALLIFGIQKREKRLLFAPILLLLALDFREHEDIDLDLRVKVVETEILQEEKWKIENQTDIVLMNFEEIRRAIGEGYDMVVLPESTFPFFLNTRDDVLEILKELSQKITIWTGGLYFENQKSYNASFIFQNGKFEVAKKVVLVPFGEYVPLPKFMRDWINEVIFQKADDFTPAQTPTDIEVSGVKFRNAICYEATSNKIYDENMPKFVVATSNNGWFLPSIEPSLQKLLMQHFANKYGVTIFHSANRSGTGVVSAN